MRQAFVCNPGYGRRISGYTGRSAALFFVSFAELRNAMGAVGVLLMECGGFHGSLFEFIPFNQQENGPA